jgi:hypothetical protein
MSTNGESGPGSAEAALDPKWETAVFGREVEDFVEHDRIGQYLIARAKEDIASAQEKLLEADPTDAKTIAKLQLDARVATRVRGWLADAIQNGRDAETLINQERDEHGS